VMKYRKPEVRISEFAENSINLELLIWIDIGKVAEKDIRSQLYYTIFEAFSEAGIEIPFPQREIHIRSESNQKMDLCTGDHKDSEFCRTIS
jgi:small-conductance mechanosensitive channel